MPVAKRSGPCDHCAATESPMWRKGPLESPTLCNACGARFLVKKTLEGYMPKARGGVPGPPAAAGPPAAPWNPQGCPRVSSSKIFLIWAGRRATPGPGQAERGRGRGGGRRLRP